LIKAGMESGETGGKNCTENRKALSQHSATGIPVDHFTRHKEYQCKSSSAAATHNEISTSPKSTHHISTHYSCNYAVVIPRLHS